MKRKLSRSDIAQLHELGVMKEKGILTQDEFTAQKTGVLSGDPGRASPGRLPLWLAGVAAVLLIIVAVVGSSSGRSAAHELGTPTQSN